MEKLGNAFYNINQFYYFSAFYGQHAVVEYLLDCRAMFMKNKENLTFIDLAIKQNQKAVLMKIILHDRYYLI
jgi:hypothetical protein